jgi:hypothetical protein
MRQQTPVNEDVAVTAPRSTATSYECEQLSGFSHLLDGRISKSKFSITRSELSITRYGTIGR